MKLTVSILIGITGLIIGYKVPYISTKIVEYKKGKENIKKNEGILFSRWFQMLISIFSGIIWMLSGLRQENLLFSLLIGILITIGIIIVFIDIHIRIIPNELVLTIAILGILFQIIYGGWKSLISAFICMIIMMIIFTAVAGFVGFGKVGAGDVKLAGAMGLALGYPLIITAVGNMAIVLLVFISLGMLLKKIYLSTMLPFAPFMISGFIFALITLNM